MKRILNAVNHDDISVKALQKHKVEFVGQAGLFVLLNQSEIVYIGQSQDIVARVATLRQEGRIAFTHFVAVDCPDDTRADFLAHYILEWNPRYNPTIPVQDTFKTAKQLKEVLDASMFRIKKYARENQIEERRGFYRVSDFADFYSWNGSR